MGNAANSGWGFESVSIASAVAAACDFFAVTDGEIHRAVEGEEFDGSDLLVLGQAKAVEYTEKQFNGPAMSDDEWASL